MAERHIDEGMAHVERQRRVVEGMKRGGHEVNESLWLLGLFEDSLATHLEHRDRLLAQLAAAD